MTLAASSTLLTQTVQNAPVVCAGCGCLCDDIQLTVERERIREAQRACPRGLEFLRQQPGLSPRYWIKGVAAGAEDALQRMVELLLQARAPGIVGLALVTVEACELACRLAEKLRAWLCPWPPDPIRFWGQRAPDLALSRGEIEQAADVVIYLGCDPDQVQPRHRERHLRRGLGENRTIFRIDCLDDSPPHQTWEQAIDLNWQKSERINQIMLLRAHLELAALLPDSLQQLSSAISSAQCVHIFVSPQVAGDHTFLEQWQLLASKQRAFRRFGISLLGSSGKARTVTETLTWRTGFPGPINYASGSPSYLPYIGELDSLLQKSALDTLLWLGSSPQRAAFSRDLGDAARHLVVDSILDPAAEVSIQIPTLDPRMDAHVVRGDGIMLRLCGLNAGAPDPLVTIPQDLLRRMSGGS